MNKSTHEMTNFNPVGEHEKLCPECDRIFITDDLRIVYCSDLCKSRANAKPRTPERKADKTDADGEFLHTCPVCGVEFRSHSKRAVYDTEACRKQAANERHYQKNRREIIQKVQQRRADK